MTAYRYYMIPKMNSVFKVLEGCCFERVQFAGPLIGVTAKNDEEEDDLNSYNLICYCCNPNLESFQLTQFYMNK